MHDLLLRPPPAGLDPALADALARAAAALARLDQAAATHPLRPALLYRTRLEAVRRQAAADGLAIDPWHLAAVLEGLRLRMDGALRIIDRGSIFAAARHALDLHQWLATPDFDQEGDIRRAERALAGQTGTPLLAAAAGLRAWIGDDGHGGAGGARPPLRAALIRFWVRQRVLRLPLPLTGARALQGDAPWAGRDWVPAFLAALADEAADALALLAALERAWFAARTAVAGRRRQSRAAMAVDILAAAPLVSASSLAAGLGMAVKNATALLDAFCRAGIVIEVTHRSRRRLFGLAGLAPLREAVRPPDRPDPDRGRGRPRHEADTDDPAEDIAPTVPPAPLTPLDRRQFDYGDLAHWMAQMDQTIRHTRQVLRALAPSSRPGPDLSSAALDAGASAPPFDSPTNRDHQASRGRSHASSPGRIGRTGSTSSMAPRSST
jgi:hypothetical protein